MNNLVPEKRLDRVGKMVTRWVKRDADSAKKNSILGTIIPTIPAATDSYLRDTAHFDKTRRAELLGKIRLEIQRDFDNQPEIIGKTGIARNTVLYRMQNRLTNTTKKMEELEASTLQALLDSPCKRYSLMQIVALRDNKSELQFRERLHYMVVDEAGNGSVYNPDFLDTVRDALDSDDLSIYPHGSLEQGVVASTLSLLQQDWARRISKGQGSARDKVDVDHLRHLLDFLMEQPYKAASIEQFLVQRDVCLDELDITLLDEYLDAPIPALGDGLL